MGDDALGLHVHRWAPAASVARARTLLLLHGTGGDEHDLVRLGQTLDEGANLLSPRGNVDERGAARFFRRLAEGVFDLDDVRRRSAELSVWCRTAMTHYGVDVRLATAVGFSNGANVAAAMMLLGVSPVKSAVLLRAMPSVEPAAGLDLRGTRVLLLGGGADPIVPAAGSHALARQLRDAGAEVDVHLLQAGHGLVRDDVIIARAWLAQTS